MGHAWEDLQRTASLLGSKNALEFSRRPTTYRDLWEDVEQRATALRAVGVCGGTRVALYGRKSASWIAALYAIWLCDGVAVPLSAELKAAQVQYVLEHAECTTAWIEPSLWARLGGALELKYRPTLLSLEDSHLVAMGNATPVSVIPQLAALLYTSGSTGRPKGIMLSADNLVAGARIVSTYLEADESDRVLSVLPFHFDYGLNQLLTCMRVGATLIGARSAHPGQIVDALFNEEISGLAGVPPLWVSLLADGSPLLANEPKALRYITNSGGTFPPDRLAAIQGAWRKTKVFLMYGLTEAFRSTFLPPTDLKERPTSIGKAIPETEILVVDPDGQVLVGAGEGELVHSGPTVALGYLKDSQATARAFRRDPRDSSRTVVFSGDRVRRDDEGYLYFVGRSDGLLKSFGHRVNAEEIELALMQSNLVKQVVIGSESDAVAGDAIIAHVAMAHEVTVDALREWCVESLANYLQPRRYVEHSSFPLTTSGKLDRTKILSGTDD